MKKTDIKTKTYEYKNGFYIDIVFWPDVVEVWLFHKKCGIKDYLFGLGMDNLLTQHFLKNPAELLELIKNNLVNQDFIASYKENYF